MGIEDEYHSWYTDADSLVTLANGFYKWVSFQMPEEMETLKELMDTVVLPQEPEFDYDSLKGETGGEYWTIERMFEDL